jgi:hypothetical protein
LKPEWWGSPLVQEEKHQEKPAKREEEIIIIIIIEYKLILKNNLEESVADEADVEEREERISERPTLHLNAQVTKSAMNSMQNRICNT